MLPGPVVAPAVARAAADTRPNVLVVVTDDQDCHSMGPVFCARMHPTDPMPRTRAWLGDRGVSYPNFFAAIPSCCPDRASLMTGQYAHNHHVRRLQEGGNLDTSTTMQAALQGSGYRTLLAGKYLNYTPVSVDPPHFDSFTVVKAGTYYDSPINDNGVVGTAGPDTYSTDLIADRTVSFISSTPADQPLYAYVAFTAPHMLDESRNLDPVPARAYADAPVAPWVAPDEADRTDKPRWVQQGTQTPAGTAALYLARQRSLYSVDDALSRIHAALRDTGRGRNTLVVFVSDNGYLLGEHGLRSKFVPYPPSLRVPLLVRWPGHAAAGRVDRRMTSMVDVAPTVYGATGIQPPVQPDGRDVLAAGPGRSRIFAEYWQDPAAISRYPTWRSSVTSGRQVSVWYDPAGTVVARESYDTGTDPDELTNTNSVTPADEALLAADGSCAGATCP